MNNNLQRAVWALIPYTFYSNLNIHKKQKLDIKIILKKEAIDLHS